MPAKCAYSKISVMRVKFGAFALPRSQSVRTAYWIHRFGEESAEEMVEWVIDEFGVSTDSAKPTILDGKSRLS